LTAPRPLGSVVIPAHDEAAVIGACLSALVEGFEPGELEVVVACNGCRDTTAEVARGIDYPVTVLELDEASKPAALREAESRTNTFPRIYLDADVLLQGSSARAVLERLAGGSVLAARPPIRYDAARSTWVVRRYYRARARIPAVMGSLWGAGVYGLSESGRVRFGAFPDVTAEDLYVDQVIGSHEIEIVASDAVTVVAPRTARDLLRVLRRTYRGKAELRERAATGAGPQQPSTLGATLRDLGTLTHEGAPAAFDALIYSMFAVLARIATKVAPAGGWERDDSSRVRLA
jgi:hypothetical protein